LNKYDLGSIFLKLGLFFFVLFIVNLMTRLFSFTMTFETWTPVDSSLILFGLSGLHVYLFLLYVFPTFLQRLFLSLIALGALCLLIILAAFSSYEVEVYKHEGYVIYIKEYRFLFSGHDDYYVKDNFIFAKKIGTGDQSEESYSSYFIEDGIFYIETQYEGGMTYVTSIELDH